MNLPEPTFNGTGFIKVYLNPVTRLHIFSPNFPPTVRNSRIHDHMFKFTSQVLIGEMEHTEWLFDPVPNGTHKQFKCYCGTDKREDPPSSIRYRGNIEVFRKHTYKAGDHYTFGGPGKYHEIACSELAVSVVTRTLEYTSYRPKLLVPYGEEPDHAFDPKDKPSVDEMRKEVTRVMMLLTK